MLELRDVGLQSVAVEGALDLEFVKSALLVREVRPCKDRRLQRLILQSLGEGGIAPHLLREALEVARVQAELLRALEGAVGLPVYANFQAGLFLPTGEIIATGGYIIGFILAAGLVGYLVEKGWGANVLKLSAAMLMGAAGAIIPFFFLHWSENITGFCAFGLAALGLVLGSLMGKRAPTSLTAARLEAALKEAE